jgi:MarR family transcriptional regulator for hemolysin
VNAPTDEPIGLLLTRVAKLVSRAFNDQLEAAGGSLPTWALFVSLMRRHHGAQRELAHAVGIEGPTLTHHLNRLETAGLITRTREPSNRRVHRVELTDDGRAAFQRLLPAVTAFDQRLRQGFDDDEIRTLRALLARLAANVDGEPPPIDARP